jgi:BirA family biotin operon repressor/biotin-[acetyl-CoA-carboxylase] ligase
MNERTLKKALTDLPLGGIRFFNRTGSTNDVALAWATEGASDLALVYAEEQTAGRGRGDRYWYTPMGTALAFSLVMRPQPSEQEAIPLFSGLGAVALCETLEMRRLQPAIKWPNDVLLNRRKVSGILAESVWMGERVDSIVLGMGVNVKLASVPPPEQLNFPATSLEGEGAFINASPEEDLYRQALLRDILGAIVTWRPKIGSDSFINAWEDRLAFRREKVEIWSEGEEKTVGILDGLERNGSLRLRVENNEVLTFQFGEIHLRPVV